MSIKDQLTDMLKDAIKTNDVKTKNVIRQLRTKVSEYCYTQNLPRDSSDDDVWKKVILSYQKSISKAIDIMKRNKKTDLIQTYEFEVSFCNKFLPKTKTEEEIKEIVKEAIETLGSKHAGKIIGYIMKNSEPGTVDARVVKSIVSEMV